MRRGRRFGLSAEQKMEISRGLACGSSFRKIAEGLKRAVSTVCRSAIPPSLSAQPSVRQAENIGRLFEANSVPNLKKPSSNKP